MVSIHIPSIKELFVPWFLDSIPESGVLSERVLKEMASSTGADSLVYLPIREVSHGIGIQETSLCKACITGKYPAPAGEDLYNKTLQQWIEFRS